MDECRFGATPYSHSEQGRGQVTLTYCTFTGVHEIIIQNVSFTTCLQV